MRSDSAAMFLNGPKAARLYGQRPCCEEVSTFFFSSRRRHTRSVSAFLLNRSSDLEFTENIINGVERPVKAAELFAFTLRVRAGNTDVLTDAEENVRQKLRAEGVM